MSIRGVELILNLMIRVLPLLLAKWSFTENEPTVFQLSSEFVNTLIFHFQKLKCTTICVLHKRFNIMEP